MAAGWVAMLQMVPWGEVIKNAPKVADGAVKLWNTVSKRAASEDDSAQSMGVMLATEIQAVERLEHQLSEAQNSIVELQAQVVQSAALIKDLASQNAQLVAQVEVNRKAVTVLGVALALTILLGVVQALVLFGA